MPAASAARVLTGSVCIRDCVHAECRSVAAYINTVDGTDLCIQLPLPIEGVESPKFAQHPERLHSTERSSASLDADTSTITVSPS
jgi:hypothetical protein